MAQEKVGFAVYLSGTVDTADANNLKINLKGVAYVFRKDEKGWWNATHHLDLKKKEIAKDRVFNDFPKMGSFLRGSDEGKKFDEYWGFLSGGNKVKEPEEGESEQRHGRWKMVTGEKADAGQF